MKKTCLFTISALFRTETPSGIASSHITPHNKKQAEMPKKKPGKEASQNLHRLFTAL